LTITRFTPFLGEIVGKRQVEMSKLIAFDWEVILDKREVHVGSSTDINDNEIEPQTSKTNLVFSTVERN